MPALRTEDLDFLSVILPQIGVVKEQGHILASNDAQDAREEAAFLSMKALCLSLGAFERHIIRSLKDFPTPVSPDTALDLAWLDTVAVYLDEVLRGTKNEYLVWPPPELRDPPAIARDLTDVYRSAAEGTRLFRPSTQISLTDVIKPIRSKACRIVDAWPQRKGSPPPTVILPQTGPAELRPSLGQRVMNGMTILSLCISLAQGPGAVLDVGPDSVELKEQFSRVASIAAYEVLDSATDIGRELRVGYVSGRAPWVLRDSATSITFRPGGRGF